MMNDLLSNDNDYSSSTCTDQHGGYSVGLFIYMWVSPRWRGKHIGDLLLEAMKTECRIKNDTHMLLVHDDDGTGRLVNYYAKRGFKDVSAILKDAMIIKL